MVELWTCAHGGMSKAVVEALGLDGWHNWGWWPAVPQDGERCVPLASLRWNELPSNWPESLMAMIGNEPTNPTKDGDGYLGRARAAGYHAGGLAQLVGMESGQDADHLPLTIAGNFWAGDLSKQPGTCYDGTPETRDAGPEYWNEYFTGWQSNYPDFDAWGIHYYTRSKPANFDLARCISILEEYHAWHGGDVYLTELGVEEYRFDVDACCDFLDKLVNWAMTKPWMRAICWCQWPEMGSDARLALPDWRGPNLTPLGRHYRDLGRMIRATEPVEPPEPSEPHLETVELMSDSSWILDGYQYDVRVTRRRL